MRIFIRVIRVIRGPNREEDHGFHEFHGLLPVRPWLVRVKTSQTGSNRVKPNHAYFYEVLRTILKTLNFEP
jgi:hypothetical protein